MQYAEPTLRSLTPLIYSQVSASPLRRSAMFIVRIVITIPSAPEERHLRMAGCRSSGAREGMHRTSINIALLRSGDALIRK
jgi:hypothetical protein